MDENAAREVCLLRSIETGTAADGLLSGSDRQHAARTAAELARWDAARGTAMPAAESFLAHRARLLLERLGATHPAIARAARALSWRPVVGLAVVVAALFAGLLLEQVADRGHVNLLAFPLAGILAWNLLVYVALLVASLWPPATRGQLGWLRGALSRLATRAVGPVRDEPAASVGDFVLEWSRVVAPLSRVRAARVLHLAAASLAIGAVAGLYLRGLVFDYRVGWESTFLEAPAVHALLATLLGPAAALLGVSFPGVDAIAALRFGAGGSPGSGTGAGGAVAATWIHLHALTVGLVVILPRLLLAAVAGLREARLARHLPIDLEAPYFRRLLTPFLGTSPRLRVLPYSHAPDDRAREGLVTTARALLGEAVQVEVLGAVAYGDEDRAAAALAGTVPAAPSPAASATLVIALFNLAATPEVENHGRFLEALRAAGAAPLAVLVDVGPYARRLGPEGGARIEERCRSWRAFVAARGLRCACVDLAAPPLAELERELGPALAGHLA